MESSALARKALEQRCGSPKLAMLRLKLHDSRMHLVESDAVGVEHGPAAPSREAVAVDINEIDVGRAVCDAVLEDARAFVDQRVNRALDDLLVSDRTAPDARFHG